MLCQELEPPLQIGQCVMPEGGSFEAGGFRVNKQRGGLSGWKPPSPWGLAWPFVAFNPSTLY